MPRTTYYRCEQIEPKVHTIRKYDSDFNLVSWYTVSGNQCNCPAHIPYCRHRAMVDAYKKGQWPRPSDFYDWDRKKVVEHTEPENPEDW